MMQVSCGADWPTTNGNRRSYSISLDKSDLADLIGEEKVSEMSSAEILRALNKRADSLVIKYVYEAGGISKEIAEQKLRALANG